MSCFWKRFSTRLNISEWTKRSFSTTKRRTEALAQLTNFTRIRAKCSYHNHMDSEMEPIRFAANEAGSDQFNDDGRVGDARGPSKSRPSNTSYEVLKNDEQSLQPQLRTYRPHSPAADLLTRCRDTHDRHLICTKYRLILFFKYKQSRPPSPASAPPPRAAHTRSVAT